MRNSMSVRRGTWKLLMLVLTMALTHGSYYGKEIGKLEMKKVQEVQAISETSVQAMACSICQSYEHLVEKCPTIPSSERDVWNHLNFSWKPKPRQYTQPAQALQQASNLEQAIVNLSKIDNVQYAISRLTNLNTVQDKGKFPSEPHQNPKGIHEVEAQEGESSKVREVKAVITLRSGKEVDQPTSKPKHDEESVAEKEKSEEIKGKRKGKSTKKDDHDSSVDEEPERIDLCTVKRGLNVNKKAFLNEQVNAIIQCKYPMKYKDPSCPTILVSIGGTCVEKTLLDLGASVNLLSYSVYKQLGLGELKPTSITLSLVDRSVKIPRGMIEDVLVQVDKFYYPVDFVVLDTNPVVK
ncbi:hypothetical protein CK203_030463 [Vitis vinifera]|uniref:Uncharacterized protein n=1 Tax=Vitis vinifera TaxID=29760 RepID=A0A438JDM2_VITVI|nr:hypothetical protein CK203_030463 [Vitis vinifera]